MNWPEKDHPIWRLAIVIAQTFGLGLILMVTASNFDSTEGRTVMGGAVLFAIRELFGMKSKGDA